MAVTINASTTAGLVQTADTSGVLALQTAGTTALTVDASQNVGIGVTPSTWTSTKAIEVGSLGTALWSSGAGSTSLSAGMYYNSGWKYANGTSKPSLIDFDNAGKITFYTVTATGTAGNAASLTATTAIDNSGNLQFNSGYGSAATAYGCRAWVNFNGTGTVAIRGSGNVSSITDNGTGDYRVNFTTAMPDINYCSLATGTGNEGSSIDGYANLRDTVTNKLVGSVRVQEVLQSGSPYDTPNMNVAIFR